MENSSKRAFLGGTCNGSKWRDYIIPYLKISYFNPVVGEETEESKKEEEKQKKESDYLVYVLTPKNSGFYSIAEVVEDSVKNPHKTVFCVVEIDRKSNEDVEYLEFSKEELCSLQKIKKIVSDNGAKVCEYLKEVIDFLNNKVEK